MNYVDQSPINFHTKGRVSNNVVSTTVARISKYEDLVQIDFLNLN